MMLIYVVQALYNRKGMLWVSSTTFLPHSKTDDKNDSTLYVAGLGEKIRKNKIYRYTYSMGVRSSIHLRRSKRNVKRTILKIVSSVSNVAVSSVHKAKKSVLETLGNVFHLFYDSYSSLQKKKNAILQQNSKKSFSARTNIILYTIHAFLRPMLTVCAKLFNYVAPVAAIFLFMFTVEFFTNLNFGLQVSLNDETLGYIKNEEVFQVADKLMQGRINYAENEEVLYSTPEYKVVFVSDDEFLKPTDLCDQIILSSGTSVTEASGLYINNVFMGATTEGGLVENTLTDILNSKKIGLEDETVEFTQDIKLEKGLYLSSSMMSDTWEMLQRITGESQITATYVLKEGDTPSGVAQKLGISVDSINILNPTLGDKFPQGEEIVVEKTKPFLTVVSKGKVTYDESIPYEAITEEDATKNKGYSEVVQEGEEGVVKRTAEVSYEDGMEVARTVVVEQVMKEPVEQKTVLGTKVVQKVQAPVQAPQAATAAPNTVAASSGGSTGSGQFLWPVQGGGKITCGWLGYSGHRAIDIQSYAGDNILAADGGTVVKVVYGSTGYGYHVVIDHGNGYKTLYAHMSGIYVTNGQTVARGQAIGAEGRTGRASGIHLHFEVIKNGVQTNPANYY